MPILLHHANLILKDAIRYGYVIVEGTKILQVGGGEEYPDVPYECKIDLSGRYLSPGFVELHTHGAGGADFMDGTIEAFEVACNMHLQHGTTTILPTILAAAKEDILRSIDCFRKTKTRLEGNGPYLHGLHMEGPYLNQAQCGAIEPWYIRNPDPEEYELLLEYGRRAIARWTLAVETEEAGRFIKRLTEEGILPSIGHSDAEYIQVKAAYDLGVTHVTHLYSGMSTIVRRGGFRHSGVLESAFCIPEMTVEVIADGCHLPIELLDMVYRVKGVDKVALTCDSMRCAGQNAKRSVLGKIDSGRKVLIEDGVAKLMDRSAFAGSIATDDRLVRVMYHKAKVPLYDAVRMMTLTPASIIGLNGCKGSIEAGKDADLIWFDEDIMISGVMTAGKIQHTYGHCLGF